MAKYQKWLGYLLFIALVGGLFLYFCFPSKAICDYLQGSAARFAPNLTLRVDRIRPALPLGLELQNTDLRLKQRPGLPLFRADRFTIRPSMKALTRRRPVFYFDCGAYGGQIQGIIEFNTFSLKGPVHSDIKIRRIRLAQYPRLKEWLHWDVTGVVSGTVAYACSQGNLTDGRGEGDLSLSNGRIRFAQPFLGLEAVEFSRIQAQMALDKQTIALDPLEFEGEAIQGEVSGTIYLKPSLDQSSLDLTVTLEDFSAFTENPDFYGLLHFVGQGMNGGQLTIRIRGTAAQPQISLA